MSTINERIKQLVAFTGLTKTSFAKEINLTQSMVSKLCSGSATPSERTISDICRVFYVNEIWLTTGEGEMINYAAKEAAVSAYCSESTNLSPELRQSIAKMLSKLPNHLYPKLEKMLSDYLDNITKAEAFTEDNNKKDPPQD